MARVFLDANVLFSAAYRGDTGLRKLWGLPAVELATSEYAIQEATANLPHADQCARLRELLKSVQVVRQPNPPPDLPPGTTLPQKDVPILQAAIAARADILLTGDITHFGRYYGKTLGGVCVLPPASFLRSVPP
ncbi:MAG: PIN domain-containing protein [Lentisphaerae bacterium]|nr:PIN domain-containing protein [Lentisphaerota bacterium]